MVIHYNGRNLKTGIWGYSDSDYAADIEDRKSTHGYAYLMAGAAISWCSQKQASTSTSTTEAEYVGLCNATKFAAWLTTWLTGANRECFYDDMRIQLYGDNQSALKLVKNPEFHARTKHIDVQYHYVREALEDGLLDLAYIPTSEMAADIFTKPLQKEKFQYCLFLLGLTQG